MKFWIKNLLISLKIYFNLLGMILAVQIVSNTAQFWQLSWVEKLMSVPYHPQKPNGWQYISVKYPFQPLLIICLQILKLSRDWKCFSSKQFCYPLVPKLSQFTITTTHPSPPTNQTLGSVLRFCLRLTVFVPPSKHLTKQFQKFSNILQTVE